MTTETPTTRAAYEAACEQQEAHGEVAERHEMACDHERETAAWKASYAAGRLAADIYKAALAKGEQWATRRAADIEAAIRQNETRNARRGA